MGPKRRERRQWRRPCGRSVAPTGMRQSPVVRSLIGRLRDSLPGPGPRRELRDAPTTARPPGSVRLAAARSRSGAAHELEKSSSARDRAGSQPRPQHVVDDAVSGTGRSYWSMPAAPKTARRGAHRPRPARARCPCRRCRPASSGARSAPGIGVEPAAASARGRHVGGGDPAPVHVGGAIHGPSVSEGPSASWGAPDGRSTWTRLGQRSAAPSPRGGHAGESRSSRNRRPSPRARQVRCGKPRRRRAVSLHRDHREAAVHEPVRRSRAGPLLVVPRRASLAATPRPTTPGHVLVPER